MSAWGRRNTGTAKSCKYSGTKPLLHGKCVHAFIRGDIRVDDQATRFRFVVPGGAGIDRYMAGAGLLERAIL